MNGIHLCKHSGRIVELVIALGRWRGLMTLYGYLCGILAPIGPTLCLFDNNIQNMFGNCCCRTRITHGVTCGRMRVKFSAGATACRNRQLGLLQQKDQANLSGEKNSLRLAICHGPHRKGNGSSSLCCAVLSPTAERQQHPSSLYTRQTCLRDLRVPWCHESADKSALRC